MALAAWLRETWRKLGTGQQLPPAPVASAQTPRDQWTIAGVYFDTSGWRLSESSATSMVWVGDRGGTMTLSQQSAAASAIDGTVKLGSARRQHRARAAAMGGGIVSVELVPMPGGGVALEVITKRPHGLGFAFEGLLSIIATGQEYEVRISADESMTGIRESVVNGQMLQLGEIQIDDIMRVPADHSTGARPIPGLRKDPYDEEQNDGALYGASDDPRLDPLFPEHPLPLIRAGLLRARTSWIWDAPPTSDSAGHTTEVLSSGPRTMLSDAALREIYWSTGRNDLLEMELKAAISSADPRGDSDDPEVARLLMMLGLAQHNSNNVLKARLALLRAVAILAKAQGEQHRDTGVALALLGRTQHALSRSLEAEQSLRRAIEILERSSGADDVLVHALARYGEILVNQKRMDEVAPLIARVQRLMANRPQATGPGLLRELVGGAPPAVVAQIKTFPSPRSG
jgi:hypothetical protein